jgi:hypothetical protein
MRNVLLVLAGLVVLFLVIVLFSTPFTPVMFLGSPLFWMNAPLAMLIALVLGGVVGFVAGSARRPRAPRATPTTTADPLGPRP